MEILIQKSKKTSLIWWKLTKESWGGFLVAFTPNHGLCTQTTGLGLNGILLSHCKIININLSRLIIITCGIGPYTLAFPAVDANGL